MKAILMDRYGPPEVLRLADVPKPEPKPGHVLIRIRASVATPPDCAFRSADPFIIRLMFGLFRPKHPIPGTSFAGEVEAVGDGVTRFSAGDRVYGASDAAFGCYAEYIVLPEQGVLAKMPDGIGFGEAVAMSEGFLTALPFLRDGAGLKPGQRILVNGAAGSVGSAAVQIAKHMGAHVTGAASARNRDFLIQLGVDAFIDRHNADYTAQSAVYDAVFDAVGASRFSRARRVLTPTGVYLTTVPSLHIILPTMRAKRAKGRRGLLMTTGLRPDPAKRADLELLSRMIENGQIAPVIDRRYPLAEAAAAHAYVETRRKRGSVVIDI